MEKRAISAATITAYIAYINEGSAMGIEVGGLFGLILLILIIWAIVSTVQSHAGTGEKVLWIVVLLVIPLFGFLLWLIFGPKGAK